MYLIAIVCPPLAILLCGKPFQAMLNVPFCLLYFPGALWAVLVVSSHKADVRNRALIDSVERSTKAQAKLIERQTRELTRAMRAQPAQVIEIQAPRPAPVRPLPKPAIQSADQVAAYPRPPKHPLVTTEGIRSFAVWARKGAVRAKEGAVFAYQNLPEWAQPITWGLALATPIILVMFILFFSRR
jgi:uncharacterized membrane protein YqaE (UPF0057 family)